MRLGYLLWTDWTTLNISSLLWGVDVLWMCKNVSWASHLRFAGFSAPAWHSGGFRGECHPFLHVLEGGRGKSSPFHSMISYLHLPEDFFFHEPSTDIRIIQVPEGKAPLPRDPWAQFPRMERISSWVPRIALGQRGSSNMASQEIHFSEEFLDSYNRFSCSLLAK